MMETPVLDERELHELSEDDFGSRIHSVLFASSPISSPEFLFGREDQLTRIRRSLMAPGRQVFVFGERGVGKSSLAGTAAVECQSSHAEPLHAPCGETSTFAGVIWHLLRQTNAERRGASVVKQEGRFGLSGLSISTHSETSDPAPAPPLDIAEATMRLEQCFAKYSKRTVAVIDEFDRIPDAAERNKFAELMKALGDRHADVKLIFTGVASSLDELLESHKSAHRQLDTIELSRLQYQPRLDIVTKALSAFNLDADPSVIYRIADVSNGFPYYVHLLTEHLLWAWYEDSAATSVTMDHLHAAFKTACEAVNAEIRRPYDQATRGRDQLAHVIWATADAFDLERTIDAIFRSYKQICETLEVEPLERNRVTAHLRSLKEPPKMSLLELVSERRTYRFREGMVRGYVRMAAACRNIQLDDASFDPPPQVIHPARQSSRKRWIDPGKFIPNVQFGASKK